MMDVINTVSKQTGLKPNQLMQYGLIGSVLLVMLGVGQTYITNIVGVAYPAFMSFVALETESTEDDVQWLTYWVCFGLFQIIDQFAGMILQLIPFYYFLKLGFMVYLFHPSTNGATTVYNTIILPYVKEYEGKVKDIYSEGVEKVQKMAANKSD